MKLEGKNAYIQLMDDSVEIGPKGWRGFGAQRGVVRVNYSDIKGLEFIPAGFLSFGFLKIISAEGAVVQGQSKYGRKGDLMADPFAVAFAKSDTAKFEEVRDRLEELIKTCKKRDDSNSPQVNNVNDIPSQIEQLSKLKDSGVLTEEEFNTKKAELLAKM